MRKFLIFILSIILLVSTSLLLVGCKEKPTYNPNDGRITITYYDGISSESKTCLIPKETLVKDFYVLKKDGCKFLGFYDNPDGGLQIFDETGEQKLPLISNSTLYAQWEKIAYNKTFYVNSTYGNSVSETRTVYSGDTIENLPIPTVKSGYEFYGWRIGEEGRVISDGGAVKEEYQVVGSSTKDIWLNTTKFYAEIGKRRYNVTLHYNDGETPDEVIKVTHGGKVENLPDLFSDDENCLDFRGWSQYDHKYKDYSTVSDYNNVREDLHIYAYWRYYKEITLIVDSDKVVKDRVYEDEVYKFSTNYTKPGFEAHKWYDGENFIEATSYTDLQFDVVTDEATYYLEWFVNREDYVSGSGSKNDPYTINSAKQLQHIAYHLDCHYKLISDIDISTITWNPIGGGKGEKAFTGSLDGDGYSIIGLKLNAMPEYNEDKVTYFGLFGRIKGEGAFVKNLKLSGVYISSSKDSVPKEGSAVIYYGAVAGSIEDGVEVYDVSVEGTIKHTGNTNSQLIVGGLCGRADKSNVYRCENNVVVTIADLKTISGGIVGYARGGVITQCKNYAVIKAQIYGKNGFAYAATICGATSNYEEDKTELVTVSSTASATATRYNSNSSYTGPICYSSDPEISALETSTNY